MNYYNAKHPEHPISSATTAILTGQLATDGALVDLVKSAISNPVEALDTPLEYPAEFPVAEYAVNIGLTFKGRSPRGARKSAYLPALDIAIPHGSDQPRTDGGRWTA